MYYPVGIRGCMLRSVGYHFRGIVEAEDVFKERASEPFLTGD